MGVYFGNTDTAQEEQPEEISEITEESEEEN